MSRKWDEINQFLCLEETNGARVQLPDVQGHGVRGILTPPLPYAPPVAGARQVASADSVGVACVVLS